jgi:hypothetical protein
MRAGERERGQASVELLLVLPLVVALLVAGWQGVLLGQTWWLAGGAARAAARAVQVGGDPARAARAALPPGAWRRDVAVSRLADGRVRVRLAVPPVVGGVSPGAARVTVGVGGAS